MLLELPIWILSLFTKMSWPVKEIFKYIYKQRVIFYNVYIYHLLKNKQL